jgi:hypothetical protein
MTIIVSLAEWVGRPFLKSRARNDTVFPDDGVHLLEMGGVLYTDSMRLRIYVRPILIRTHEALNADVIPGTRM